MNSSIPVKSESTYPRWILIVTVMAVAILEVLDTTIVNVSLPSMMPALGANQEKITWILTSYVVASAIMIPLTGYLSARLGQKKLLLINIVGFMISSFFCGLSESLSVMVFFRLFQGAFGAALIPLSQAIMKQNYSLSEQGKAMAIWGIGIMSAPALGPVLGGFITENWSWRWVFYINVPICLSALTLTWFFVQDTPITKLKLDKIGLLFMVLGVGSLQCFLDQGNPKDWFSSTLILCLSISSVLFISLFLIRCLAYEKPFLHLALYKDRNFALGSILMAVYCGGLFSILILEPVILETIFNYPILQAGYTMSPCGLASVLSMVLSGMLIKRINAKFLISLALCLSALGAWQLSSLNLEASQYYFVKANSLIGLGLGFFMVPNNIYTLATLAPQDITEGASLYAYARMLGTSVFIAIFTTILTRHTQTTWYALVGHISNINPNLYRWLTGSHMNLQSPQTPQVIANILNQHASMVSFAFVSLTISLLFLSVIPLALLLKTVQLKDNVESGH